MTTYHEKIQELTDAGQFQGEDYCSHRMSAKVFTIHRPLKASELHMLTARIAEFKDKPAELRGAYQAAAVVTCTYPDQRPEVERIFERYGMSVGDIASKLMGLAGGEEYTDPKEEAPQASSTF
jgi:hypothetical protein